MNDQNDQKVYRIWLQKGLEKPGKSQRGLARVLKLDPMQVSRLVHGKRRFQIADLGKIAHYLDEQLPTAAIPLSLLSKDVKGVHVLGRVSTKYWQDGDVDLGQVAGLIDRRFTMQDQCAFVMDEDAPTHNLLKGSYLICVPYKTYVHHALSGSLCVVKRSRDGLTNFSLHRVGEPLKDDNNLAYLVIAVNLPLL